MTLEEYGGENALYALNNVLRNSGFSNRDLQEAGICEFDCFKNQHSFLFYLIFLPE